MSPDWAVFPVGRDKKPLVPWKAESRPREQWNGDWPPGANTGIDCGKSGLLVLDEDQPGALQDWLGTVPETHTVRTGRDGGGRHLYFTVGPGQRFRNSAGKVAPGVDVRAQGGYVVAEGSTHETGARYEVEDPREPVPLPDRVADLLRAAEAPQKVELPLDRAAFVLPARIATGGRADTLFRYAASLTARRLRDEEALVLLQHAYARCDPPWTAASDPGGYLSERVLWESVQRRYGGDAAYRRLVEERTDWRRADREASRRVDAEEERQVADEAGMWVTGVDLADLPAIAPIWGDEEHLLAAEGQGWMIVGPDGTGKTSTASQYVKARLALPGWGGFMWGLPVKPLAPGQGVIYLAMDRPRQMMEAFVRGLSRPVLQGLDGRLLVHKGPPSFPLSGEPGQRWLLQHVLRWNAGLVVLDSRKDLGSTVDPIQVAGVARAVQLLSANDIEVLVLAHPVKGRRNGPPTLEDVSGLRDVFSGLGSVVFLDGGAGRHHIDVHQVKPIRELVPPFKILHDHATGRSERFAGLTVKGGALVEGRAPVSANETKALQCIDAHPSGWAPAPALREVLHSDNLSRDLRPLVKAGIVVSNGQRGAQSAYGRGPQAPPRP